MTSRSSHRRFRLRSCRSTAATLLVVVGMLLSAATASAQLDPLLFIKRVNPTVIVVFDTSAEMLQDGEGNYYDPGFWSTTADAAVVTGAFSNINPLTTATYRRVFRGFDYDAASGGKYTARAIEAVAAVWDPANPLTSNAEADEAFLAPTRYAIAKAGVTAAVRENAGASYRWGFIKLRQDTPQWRASGCDKPVAVTDSTQMNYTDASLNCKVAKAGSYGVMAPSVAKANYELSSPPNGTIMVEPKANTASTIVTLLSRKIGDHSAVIPAGIGGVGFVDRPLTSALTDAKDAVMKAMNDDSAANRSCRNTIVVLVTGGRDSGGSGYSANARAKAAEFLTVSAGGVTRRVPIHVVAVKPNAADETSLQEIATESGGVYSKATTADEVARAVNHAVQGGFARATDIDAGKESEFVAVSPIVGTVNMKGASSSTGATLPNTDINAIPGGQHLPQRSNMIITAGFSLPGFQARIRAFRTYVPVLDDTQPVGWKFVNDGTKLWPDLDGRPEWAGLARTPADVNSRNIYTFVPDGAGGGSVVAFNSTNAPTLANHLQTSGSDTSALIELVRSQPIGAIIGSTPALMDPPSLDPPPDDDYGRVDAPGTFAGDHKERRGIIFFGANDGMIHAVDARTGYEVWAFIPYNLLPKLRALRDGQPVEQFDYFVDSSPKIAEVKLNGDWRSMLIIGQGQGGTFYQAFDVTEAGMGVPPDQGDIGAVSALLTRFDQPNESIVFKWAYPNYNSFDPTYTAKFAVGGWPGNTFKVYGDLKSTASYAEKTMGFTWSDPAVGPLDNDRTVNAVIAGSGFFPDVEQSIPGRGNAAPEAGSTLYLINADTGQLVGNPGGGSCAGVGCLLIPESSAANGRKNTLQADPTAAASQGGYVVNKAYIGDTDGRYWRFNFDATGKIENNLMVDTGVPIFASSALLFVGSADIYMFFATGSDILPSNFPGGKGTFRLYGLKDNYPAAGATTKFAHDLSPVTDDNNDGVGTGERPSTSPSVAGDIVFYTTTTETEGAPCADFSANLYAMTYAGGAAYDVSGNGKIDTNESVVVKTVGGRATAPFIVDQHLYFATSGNAGALLEAFGDPEDFNNGIGQVGVRILSWREIR